MSIGPFNRWSIITSERSMPLPRKVVLPYEPIAAFEDSIVSHLSKILQSDDHTTVISSAKYVCYTSLTPSWKKKRWKRKHRDKSISESVLGMKDK